MAKFCQHPSGLMRVALLVLASLAACDSGEAGQRAAPRPRPAEVLLGELKEFLFFIIDRPTHSLLFLGRVLDPRAG
jgi:serine protease inhibitor